MRIRRPLWDSTTATANAHQASRVVALASARATALAAAFALAALAGAGVARADGDPASDILLVDKIYLPYGGVSTSAQKTLRDTVEASAKAGYPIRVALIADRSDLGAVTVLWGKPRRYATFLGVELSLLYKGPLLIVMPAGIGFAHHGHATAAEYRVLSSLQVDAGRDGLAATAAAAVQKLAARSGHPFDAPAGSSGSSFPVWAIAAAAVAGLAVLAAVGAMLLRRRAAREGS